MTDTLTRRLAVNGGALADIKPARLNKKGRTRIPAKARSRQAFEQAAADLEAAADRIESNPNRWTIGTIGLYPHSKMCALGHVSCAISNDGPFYPSSLSWILRRGQDLHNERRVSLARELLSLEVGARYGYEVETYNDHQASHEPVVQLLRRAAMRARRLAAWYKR